MRNEKTAAHESDGSNEKNKLKNKPTTSNVTQTREKTQQVITFCSRPAIVTTTSFGGQKADDPFCFTGMRLTCDECCLPLYLYGVNYIESHSNGRSYLLKCLCDSHADEFLGVQK